MLTFYRLQSMLEIVLQFDGYNRRSTCKRQILTLVVDWCELCAIFFAKASILERNTLSRSTL